MADPTAAEPPGPVGSTAPELPDVAATVEEQPQQQQLSKSARKKLLKRQRQEQRKAERRTAEKERRRFDLERRRHEWDERLASAGEEERARLVAERREARLERMGRRAADRAERATRLRAAADAGHKVAVDLDFAELMATNEIHSLVHQLMFCYAVNGKCATPAHLMLTGCKGEIQKQLERLPGYERWILEKEPRSYIEAFEDQKEKLVYLTADSDVEIDNLDLNRIYIIGGLVDRNRWKGITLKRAQEQGIQTARLPISNYLKLSSSQVLTVNQVFEVLLKFIETRDWKDAFLKVIPQRKQSENEVEHGDESTKSEDDCGHDMAEDLAIENDEGEEEDEEEVEERETKRTRLEHPENGH